MVDVVGSFMRGFQSGAGIVDDYNRRQRETELYEQGQEDRKQRLADAQTRRERGETLWQQSQEDRAQGLKDAEAQRARQKTLEARQDTQWKQSQEQYSHQKTLQNRQKLEQMQADRWGKMSLTGEWIDPSDEEMELYDENPHHDFTNLLMPDSIIGRNDAIQVVKRLSSGESISRTDPKLLRAMNATFPEIVNNASLPTTHNGKDITNREISAVDISPDGKGFMITQTLTLSDGSQLQVPVTENRSGDPSDQVMVVPFETATKRLGDLSNIDLSMSDEQKQRLFSLRYQRGLVKSGVDTNSKAKLDQQLMKDLAALDIREADALQDADPESIPMIQASYKQMRDRLKDTHASLTGAAGKPISRTRTDSKKFKSDIKTFENIAEQLGIEWNAEVKADVEEFYRAGYDAETVARMMEKKYGSKGGSSAEPSVSREKDQGLIDSFISDLKASRSGELGDLYQKSQQSGIDIPSPEIQPTQTPTGTPEEIAARARLAQAGGQRASSFDVSQAQGLEQAYGAR